MEIICTPILTLTHSRLDKGCVCEEGIGEIVFLASSTALVGRNSLINQDRDRSELRHLKDTGGRDE